MTFYDLASKLDGQAYISHNGTKFYAEIADEGLNFVSKYGDTANYIFASRDSIMQTKAYTALLHSNS